MDTTSLGPLTVSRVCLGTMLMGSKTPVEESHRMLDRYLDGRRQLPRHRRRLRRRRLGGDARAVARRPPRRGRARDQGALPGLRPRRGRVSTPTASARPAMRACAASASTRSTSTRSTRPIPMCRWRRRSRHSTGSCRRARCKCARRLQLPGLAARVGGRAPGPPRLVAVRLAAAAVLARRALDRDRDPPVLPRRRARRAAVGAARRGLPDRPLLA